MAGDNAANARTKFLALHAVDRTGTNQLFALTPSSLAITVYRQQIRALNLAYGICMQTIKPAPSQKVAVIGGGFAGITVAAGLLTKGFEVHLFEQRPELCHLQSGCETRWLHPTIYEWPSANSDLSDARLPLLNWCAGTAGDVARTVVKQFYAIAANSNGRYHEYLRASARIADDRVEWDNANTENSTTGHLGRCGYESFDVVVLAVGFGLERGVIDTASTSYWRNDRFAQPQPGIRSERREIVYISGIGDGALIDLVRVCLRGFKHDRLVDDLFGDLSLLVARLREIRDAHLEQLSINPSATLGEQLKTLRDEPSETALGSEIKKLRDRIAGRFRSDARAILNGPTSSFSRVLNARGRSFLNVVLAYCLYEAKAFSYIGGRCSYVANSGAAQIQGYGKLRFDESIIRHGTERKRVLRAVGLRKKEIRALFDKQSRVDPRCSAVRLWEPGWWSLPPEPVANDYWWLERVPRAELIVAAIALGPLEAHIRSLPSMNGCNFRATLHRCMQYSSRDNLQCYQQVAPYVGDATGNRLQGRSGRVFLTRPSHNKAGMIAVVIETGMAMFAQLPKEGSEEDKTKWSELWDRLIPKTSGGDGKPRFRAMDPLLVTTVAAVPVLANFEATFAVRYVLYVDVEHSVEGGRPTRDELLTLLWREAAGIAASVKTLRTLDVNDEPLLATKSAAPNVTMISVPGPELWSGQPQFNRFEWLPQFHQLIHVEYPDPTMPLIPDADVLELRS